MRFKDITESSQKCPHCGGPLVEYSGLMEKKDACYYKVKASAKVWPSAYASGRLVQCRKKGAANYGNKSESVAEGSGPKEKQKTPYRDINSPEYRAAVDKQKQRMAQDKAAEPGKKMLAKQGVAEAQLDEKCWDGYQQQGMKNKGGRQVPNCVPTESVAEGAEQEILFYAKLPDGSRVYARVKDEEQWARLQQQYRGAEIKTFDYNRPDILNWLEARGINLRKFTPGMVQTMYPGSRGHPGSTDLNEFAPGSGGDDETGDDPYKYPKPKRYNRSADYFEQFEADHFDREDFDDDTGVFKGYWGSKQIAYFKFDNPARTGGNNPGMGWYYEPESSSSDNSTAAPAVDNANERKQQELSMIRAFLKSGNRPNPNSQIGRLMKKHGMTGDLNEFAPSSSDNDGNDGFSDDTLKQLAAQWYNGDEDPKVEQTLAAAGWEIGQDEGYDDEPGVFVVQAGDINGNSYMSWSAEELKGLEESALSDLPRPGKRNQFRSLHKIRKQRGLDEQGVAEDAVDDFLAKGGKIETGKTHKPRKVERWQGSSHIGAAGGRGSKGTVSGQAANTNPKSNKPVVSAESLGNIKMNEKYNAEYDDEAGMADNNLQTLARAVEGIDDLIQTGDNLPEWCQEKIAVAKSMLVAVWDYMYSEEASEEVDPEIDAMFEAMDQLVHETAHAQQLSVDLVWESFESLSDQMLYETAAWRRKEGKSKKGGLNAKGVASYRRENPGSKLQMAVTTKPSKLKPGSKAAKRRKSFCARMSGVKGPMKKPNGKPTRKALALRKWNC